MTVNHAEGTSLDEAIVNYTNDCLFTQMKPVLFTDLIHEFKLHPRVAKRCMYQYYQQSHGLKYHCVIVCCFRNGLIKVINDVDEISSADGLIDCFIYAFNPMDEFIPLNKAVDQSAVLTIVNPYKLQHCNIKRSQTTEEKSKPAEKSPRPIIRPHTEPAQKETKPPLKSKNMGLKSTELLARMRREREEKEIVRQQELMDRNSKPVSQKKCAATEQQLSELQDMFDNDEDEEMQDFISKEETPSPDLEDVLNTTAEDSLLEVQPQTKKNSENHTMNDDINNNNNSESIPEPKKTVTTHVDADGYMVAERKLEQTPKSASTRVRRPADAPQRSKPAKKIKHKQESIESFFRKR